MTVSKYFLIQNFAAHSRCVLSKLLRQFWFQSTPARWGKWTSFRRMRSRNSFIVYKCFPPLTLKIQQLKGSLPVLSTHLSSVVLLAHFSTFNALILTSTSSKYSTKLPYAARLISSSPRKWRSATKAMGQRLLSSRRFFPYYLPSFLLGVTSWNVNVDSFLNKPS